MASDNPLLWITLLVLLLLVVHQVENLHQVTVLEEVLVEVVQEVHQEEEQVVVHLLVAHQVVVQEVGQVSLVLLLLQRCQDSHHLMDSNQKLKLVMTSLSEKMERELKPTNNLFRTIWL